MTFECPGCHRISHNPNDAAQRYCGACHRWWDERAARESRATNPEGEMIVTDSDGDDKVRNTLWHLGFVHGAMRDDSVRSYFVARGVREAELDILLDVMARLYQATFRDAEAKP